MLVFNLIGGLGNQMFQFAAGKALSARTGIQIAFYTGEFSNYALHQGFELQRVFHLDERYLSDSEVKAILGARAKPFIQKVLTRLPPAFSGRHLSIERTFSYTALRTLPEVDLFFRGYWQSYKYFENEANAIKACFQFNSNLNDQNRATLQTISETHSVSIHIRRGDYLSDTKSASIFEVCRLNYYELAIDILKSRFTDLAFFVFSDDQAWASRELLPLIPGAVFVSHNRGQDSFRDMQLMSAAKHNIIANSSFSWWAAWLNTYPEKVVIAPKSWFKDPAMSTLDLLPPTWLTV